MALTRTKTYVGSIILIITVTAHLSGATFDVTKVYKGCYEDAPKDRYYSLNPGFYNNSNLAVNDCRGACTQFISRTSFASIISGQYCHCFDTFNENATVRLVCDSLCIDGKPCGGAADSSSASVYSLPERMPPAAVRYLSSNPFGALAYEPIIFNVYPNSSNFSSSVNFFDGITGYAPSAEQSIFHYFTYPGSFEVTATVFDAESNGVSSSLMLTVAVGLHGAELTCPAFVASTVTFSCRASVFGTKAHVSVDFGDGDTRKNLSLGSSSVLAVGHQSTPGNLVLAAQNLPDVLAVTSTPDSQTYSTGQTQGLLFVMVNQVINSWGNIFSWEFTAASLGQVILQVYRPSCASDHVYCYNTDSCEVQCLAKESITSPSPWTEKCQSSSLHYSIGSRRCFDSSGQRTWLVSSSYSRTSLTLVGETVVDVISTGFQKIILNDTSSIPVRPGDTIALYTGTCLLTYQPLPLPYEVALSPAGSWSTRDLTGYTLPILPGNNVVNFKGTHSLVARVLKSTNMVLQKAYKAGMGHGKSVTYNVSQTITGAYSTAPLDAAVQVQVQDAVSDLAIKAALYGATNHTYVYAAQISTGTSVRYVWLFGDETDSYNGTLTASATMNHTYSISGNYTIDVVAYNEISSERTQFNVTIEDLILGLNISSAGAVTEYHNVTSLTFDLTQGSSVVYSISTSDGGAGETASLLPNGTMLPSNVNAIYYGLGASYKYTFPSIGNWSVTVNASNHVSWLSAVIWLPVQISMNRLFIELPEVIPYEDTGVVNFNLVNGSHVTFSVMFDGKADRNWNVSSYLGNPVAYTGRIHLAWHEYNHTGNHSLVVSAWNLVTGYWIEAHETVWVDYRVQDVHTVPNTTFLRPADPVSFNVTMRRGSRFTASITYGDGEADSVYLDELLSDGTITFIHSYAVAGNYTVVMNTTNAVTSCACVNNTMKMIVQNPAAGLHMATNSPVSIPKHGTGLAVLTLAFDGTVLPVTDAFVLYQMGDTAMQHSSIWHYFAISNVVPSVDTYVYNTFGTYNVSLNVSNFVSYKYFEALIDVDQTVLDLAIVSDLKLVVFNVTEVKFTISMSWGSRVILVWDWLDRTPNESAPYDSTLTNMKAHTYATVGVFYTKATAINTVNTVVASLQVPIIVQHPVTGFVLIPDKSRAVIGDPDWYYTMPFHLFVERGVPLSTNATYKIDFGDGNFSEPLDLNSDRELLRRPYMDNGSLVHVITFTHKYYVADIYNINISIWNLVSANWYDTSIKMYEAVKGLHGNVTLLYNKDGSGTNASDTRVKFQPGYGTEANFFPLDMGIFIQTWCLRGVFLNYFWDLGDGNGTALYYEVPSTTYKYENPGTYKIVLVIFNEMISVNISWTVKIQRRIGPVNITAIPASPIKEITVFQLYPGWIGTDACYYINLVDTTSVGSSIRFLGSESTCTKYYSQIMQQGMKATWMSVEEITAAVAASGGYLEVDNIFNANNLYFVRLIVINEVSMSTYVEKIAVTTMHCLYPVVNVDSINPCLTPEMCDHSLGYPIKRQYKGIKWYIDSAVTIDCATTSIAFYTWQIFVVNATTGDETPYSGDASKFQTNSPRQLVVPPLTLEYGLYRFELNVTMDYEIGLHSSDSLKVFVVRSPLVGAIAGGEFRRKGFGSNVTFDAISLTGDPDNPGDKSGFWCKWMCRRWCETFPVYDKLFTKIEANGTSTCPIRTHNPKVTLDAGLTYSTGGCFKFSGTTSAGLFPPDLYDPADPTGCTIMQDFFGAYEGETIFMKVVIGKESRTIDVFQTVDVAYGDPPEIIAVCTSNCGDAVNYNAKLAYASIIAKTHKGISYAYSWRLLVNLNGTDYRGAVEVPPDEWAPYNSTGIESENIALDANTFQPDDADGRIFFLEVSAYRADGNASNYGRNYKSFVINESPTAGNCSVYPPNGTALATTFNTKCETPFYDKHLPLTYTIGYSTTFDPLAPNYEDFQTLASGVNRPSIPGAGSILPGGINADYLVYILIRCFDRLGAWTNFVTSVEVLPPPQTSLTSLTGAIRDSSGAVQNLIASKDSTQAFNFMGAVLTSMNNAAVEWNETDSAFTCREEADIANSTGQITGNVTYEDFKQDCITKLHDKYLRDKAEMVAIKESAMLVASQMPLAKVDDASLALSFLGTGTGKTDEMSHDAQEKSHSVMQESLKLMQNDESQGQLDPMVKYRMSKQAVGVMGNLMQASALSVKLENEEAVAANGTAAAALQNARRKRSATSTTTAADLQTQIERMSSDVGDLLLKSIVSGEAPTKLETTNMNMLVEKSPPDKAAKKELSGGGKMSLPSGDAYAGNGTDAVQSKIVVHRLNPLFGTNDTTGNSNLTVTSNVVQLSLLDSSGGAMNVDNVDAPTHLVINRDPSQISLTKVVGTTCSTDSSQRMTTYKVLVPAHSSLHLKVRQIFNDTNKAASAAAVKRTAAANNNSNSNSSSSAADLPVEEVQLSSLAEENEVSWVVYVAAGTPPKTTDYLFMCNLPYLTDPVAAMIDAASLNASGVQETTSSPKPLPAWAANVPTGIAYELDTCFASNSLLNNTEDAYYFVGIKYVPPPVKEENGTTTTPVTTTTMKDPSTNSTSSTSRSSTDPPLIFFEMEIYSSMCKYWDYYVSQWATDGCEVGPYSSPSLTHCICYKLAPKKPVNWTDESTSSSRKKRDANAVAQKPMSFGAAMSVPINTINLADSAFNHLDENPLVFSVMISIVCMYLCLLVWAKREDMLDKLKAGSSPLLDNDPRDQHLYELVVYTGQRTRAGTTSRVSMILSGEEDETPPRLIYDDKRPVLQKGGVDSFVMATPRSLGPLTMLRVWHNNSGKNPGWFFDRMQVTDLQTGAKYYFIVNRWLAIEEDDAAIDRIVPVAGKEEMTTFNHLFWTKARKDLMDGHIWFSIFGRPHMSQFTRCQRLTVCLTLLFATMTANIAFYKTGGDKSTNTLKIGSITLSLQQILTGVYSSLIVFPASIIIMQLFRKAGERPKNIVLPKQKNFFSFLEDDDNNVGSQISTAGDPSDKGQTKKKKKKKKSLLPWWIIYVAYTLSAGAVTVSVWYTVEVAGVFGPEKAQQWLISFIASFFESMLFSQPIKVIGLAAFFALFIKKPPAETDIERDPALKRDETFFHQYSKADDLTDPEYKRQFERYRDIPLPPSEEYVRTARLQRQREMEMNAVLKEIILYAIFVSLLTMVGYGNSDPLINMHFQNIRTTYSAALYEPAFMPLPYTDTVMDITQVAKYDHFWTYLENTLLMALYEQNLYDKQKHEWSKNFTVDLQNVLMGPIRLRQLRVKGDACPMPIYKHHKMCSDDYYVINKDAGNYLPNWIALNTSDSTQLDLSTSEWQYKTSDDSNGYLYAGHHGVYGGGGYVVELSTVFDKAVETLAYLRQNGWVNTLTRAVFVEFNLFNANINMNTVSFIVFEFLSSGKIEPSFEMKPFRLDRYVNDYLFVVVSQLMLVIYLIYFLVKECKLVAKQKRRYFQDMWNIYELVTLSACYLWIALEIVRIAESRAVLATYRADKTKFVNMQWIANWNEVVVCYLGVIMFLATLKMTKLLRFNMRIMVIMKTFTNLGPRLSSFMAVFALIFLAFSNMCFMIFVNYLASYSSFLQTCKTLLAMMLNKFDLTELMAANQVMAVIVFVGFVILINFILINFMMTIIMESFSHVKEEIMLQKNKYEIVNYIITSMKAIVGLGKPPPGPRTNDETLGFVANTEGELSSRIEELMDKFVGVISSDPLQKSLLDTVEQRLKENKNDLQALLTSKRVLLA